MNIKNALEEIKSKREKSYTTIADVKRIINAMETDDWNEVKNSRLYRLHGGEYCELLGIIYGIVGGFS